MLYADFESILKPVDERYRDKMNKRKAERKGKAPYTEKINTHVPSGWCVHSTFAYGDVPDSLKMHRGKDFVEKFVEYIEKEVKRLYATFPQQPMIELSDVLKRGHKAVERCHICLKEFNDPQNKMVRDHCHYIGLYRGGACNNCSLKYQIPDHIPTVFHNLSGYDTHLLIKELGKRFNRDDIGVIVENKKKYISFNVKINVKLAGVSNEDGKEVRKHIQLRFIDSCRFTASDLDKMASNLGDDQCKHLREFYKEEEVFRLMRRKGVYPYEYMDGCEKFEEPSLSLKDAFYSRLNMKGISDKDYEYVQQVWNRITPEHENITLGDYHDVYLATDVFLLADVFETFRDMCLKHYKLDPAHFCTAPGLTCQALLKTASEYYEHEKRRQNCELCLDEFRLELLTNIDMLLMFEKGIRGGITQAVKR